MDVGPVPRKQLVEAVDGVAGYELVEDVGEIYFGIDVVQFAVSMREARIRNWMKARDAIGVSRALPQQR
jgi:hypothetical protein